MPSQVRILQLSPLPPQTPQPRSRGPPGWRPQKRTRPCMHKYGAPLEKRCKEGLKKLSNRDGPHGAVPGLLFGTRDVSHREPKPSASTGAAYAPSPECSALCVSLVFSKRVGFPSETRFQSSGRGLGDPIPREASPSSSGLGHNLFTVKIAGSNPVGDSPGHHPRTPPAGAISTGPPCPPEGIGPPSPIPV